MISFFIEFHQPGPSRTGYAATIVKSAACDRLYQAVANSGSATDPSPESF